MSQTVAEQLEGLVQLRKAVYMGLLSGHDSTYLRAVARGEIDSAMFGGVLVVRLEEARLWKASHTTKRYRETVEIGREVREMLAACGERIKPRWAAVLAERFSDPPTPMADIAKRRGVSRQAVSQQVASALQSLRFAYWDERAKERAQESI